MTKVDFILMVLVTGIFSEQIVGQSKDLKSVKLFLGGDVMLGRGIDQAFPSSADPKLYEPYVKDARTYIDLAEKKNGPLSLPIDARYLWGDALKIWQRERPDLKLVNLETSITTSKEPWPGKAIHYKMHPSNIESLKVPDINYCSLANNHVLDWGRIGLKETLNTLEDQAIGYSGAGQNSVQAAAPAVYQLKGLRILIFSYGFHNSGVPAEWAAKSDRPGILYLPSMGEESLRKIQENINKHSEPGDLIVLSVHWGGNWGYEISSGWRAFARGLIDQAKVDLVFGHSAHHPMGIEVYREKLILYGAGDFLNDYEGIRGYEEFRSDLTLMYFPVLDADGDLVSLKMIPLKIKNFQLQKPKARDVTWIRNVLEKEGRSLGTNVDVQNDKILWLKWKEEKKKSQ